MLRPSRGLPALPLTAAVVVLLSVAGCAAFVEPSSSPPPQVQASPVPEPSPTPVPTPSPVRPPVSPPAGNPAPD